MFIVKQVRSTKLKCQLVVVIFPIYLGVNNIIPIQVSGKLRGTLILKAIYPFVIDIEPITSNIAAIKSNVEFVLWRIESGNQSVVSSLFVQ